MRKKYISIVFILIFTLLFMPSLTLAGSKKDDTSDNGTVCDDDYIQVGNSGICEKVYKNAYNNLIDPTLACKFENHSGEVCLIVTGTHDCHCEYTLSDAKKNPEKYEDYDVNESYLNPENRNEERYQKYDNLSIQFNPEDPRLDYHSLCNNDGIRHAVKIIGYVISICKWVVPLIIIVLGMIDFSKAVISSDEKAISKATSSLIKRFIAGVVVVLVPTIVMAILNAIKVTNGLENTEFGECTTCLFNPGNCK